MLRRLAIVALVLLPACGDDNPVAAQPSTADTAAGDVQRDVHRPRCASLEEASRVCP